MLINSVCSPTRSSLESMYVSSVLLHRALLHSCFYKASLVWSFTSSCRFDVLERRCALNIVSDVASPRGPARCFGGFSLWVSPVFHPMLDETSQMNREMNDVQQRNNVKQSQVGKIPQMLLLIHIWKYLESCVFRSKMP